VVTKDVAAYALVAGVPARPIGWMCHCGVRLPLPHGADGETACEACGAAYRGQGETLSPISGS
jgi:UDP-2-acetamido-3-amino-2,3-dideoxy-glucuronate N-acetyltransferase